MTIASHIEELYGRDLTCQALGIQLDEVAPGRSRVRMQVTETMVNGHGIAHGGYLFLLADTAFAFASNANGPVAVAQSAQVTFLRPVAAGDRLSAVAVQRVRVGLAGIYDVTITRPDGQVVAEFRGHSVVIPGNRLRAQEEVDD